MIHIEHRALRALQQHPLTPVQRPRQRHTHVARHRQQPRPQRPQLGQQRLGIDLGIGPQHPQRAPRPLDVRLDQLLQPVRSRQVGDTHADPGHLVGVGGADPPPRGPQRRAAPALLLGPIEQLVVGQHQVRPRADEDAVFHLAAPRLQLLQLLEQGHRIDDHAVPQRAALAFVEDAGGDLVQDELFVTDAHGVARVGAALIAGDPVGVLGQDVDDLSLPLVAPLRADDDEATHITVQHLVTLNEKAPAFGGPIRLSFGRS